MPRRRCRSISSSPGQGSSSRLDLLVSKVLAGRPKDLQDVRELLAGRRPVRHDQVEGLLASLEEALDQSDLTPLYARLRAEARPR
jgi:hypothetical protein